MKSIRFLDRRLGYSLASVGMMLGIIAPTVVPSFASAAQLTSRSIEMSSSAKDDSNVTYAITFTPSATFRQVVVDFCSESPLYLDACTLPAGFTITSPTPTYTTTGGGAVSGLATPTAAFSGTALKVDATSDSGDNNAKVLTITGVHNPTNAGQFYARIYTYDSAHASTGGYTSATDLGTYVDEGGIALEATDSIGVQAAVRETLTFCAAGATITDCASVSQAPNITLGQGSPLALDADTQSTGQVFTQLSTNAAHGAVVNMKNSNTCGGLKLNDPAVSTCDIPPVGSGLSAVASGTAMFGMKAGAATGITVAADYADATQFGMDYDPGNTTGVTSPYGDKIYSSDGPINGANVPLTFAASISNDTPAGHYSASLNLVATGTY